MEDNRNCSECGHPVPEESASCPHCGNKFETVPTVPQPDGPDALPEIKPKSNRLPMFIILGCLGLFLVSCPVTCIVFGVIGSAIEKSEKKAAVEKTEEAERLWSKGEKAGAVVIYKDLLKRYFRHLEVEKRAVYLSRVIDFDIESGDESSAKVFIRKGIERNTRMDVKGETFSRLLSDVKEEIRLEQVEKARQAEINKQNRQAEKGRGPKPEPSNWDGSFRCVKEYLKRNLNDPGSVKYESWYEAVEHGEYWAVRVRFRAKNAFGGYVLEDKIALIQNSEVVQMLDFR